MGIRDWFPKEQQKGLESLVKVGEGDDEFKVDPGAQKVAGCAACEEDIPIMVNKAGKRVHLDFFATPEAGAMYECPCKREPEDEIAGVA